MQAGRVLAADGQLLLQVNDLQGMIARGADTDFTWTTEHVLLCHLISLYGKCATRAGEDEKWIRSMALAVFTYECISAGVLDFDYAPVHPSASNPTLQTPNPKPQTLNHPGVELRANLKSISHRCHLEEMPPRRGGICMGAD